MTKQTEKALENLLQQIALDHLFIDTLETRNSDRLRAIHKFATKASQSHFVRLGLDHLVDGARLEE